MINEEYIGLVTAYLDGTITSEKRAQLNKLIDEDKIDILEIKALQNTYNKLGKLPDSEPSKQMRNSFYAMLEEEKKRQQKQKLPPFSPLLNQIQEWLTPQKMQRSGLIVIIFLIGMVAGNLFTPFQSYRIPLNQLSEEVSVMRTVIMLSLLDAQSPTDLLKSVNISTDISTAAERVISALLKTLNNDPNVNVRLASIEALLRHADNPRAREGLVKAISKQNSPQIQVALADAMLALQEKDSINELRRLLKQNELDSSVRDKLQNTIAALS
jgi:hypothetical protein